MRRAFFEETIEESERSSNYLCRINTKIIKNAYEHSSHNIPKESFAKCLFRAEMFSKKNFMEMQASVATTSKIKISKKKSIFCFIDFPSCYLVRLAIYGTGS